MVDPLKPTLPTAGETDRLEQFLLGKGDPEEEPRPEPRPVEKFDFGQNPTLPSAEEVQGQSVLHNSIEGLPICDIEGGIPITDQYLYEVHRAYFIPDFTGSGKDWVAFFKPNQDLEAWFLALQEALSKAEISFSIEDLKASVRFENPPDDLTLKRILASQNNFAYRAQLTGKESDVGERWADLNYELCRSDKKEKGGGYRLWVYQTNMLLARDCEGGDEIRLNPLPTLTLSKEEITKVVALGNLASPQYCVANDWSGKFFITGHLPTIELLESRIASSGLFPPERAEAIIEDIELAVTDERDDVFYKRMFFGSAAINVVLFGGLLYNAVLSRRLQKRAVEKLDEKIDPARFLEDHTERAKDPSYSRLVGEEADLRKFARTTLKPEMKNILISGAAGSGKGETVRGFFHRVAAGKIPHLKGYRLYSFNAENFAGAGAKWVGKFEEALSTLLEKANREPCIIYIEEAQLLAGMGTTEGKPSDILDLLKRHMSAKDSKVVIIFDTNQPDALLKDAGIGRRVTHIAKETPTFAKAIGVFEEVSKQFTNGFKLDQGAKETTVHLAGSLEGGRIAGALDLLQNLIADAQMDGKKGGTFTTEDVIQFFAREYGMTPEAVNALTAFSRRMEELGTHPENTNHMMKDLRGASEQLIGVVQSKVESDAKGGDSPKGPKRTGGTRGGPPPAAPAGGDGGVAGSGSTEPPGERKPSARSRLFEVRRPRFGETLARLGGATAVTGILSAVTAAEHYHIITPEQESLIGGSMLAAGFAADAGFAAALLGGMPGAILGHGLATQTADATGIRILKEGQIGNKIVGVAGGVAGFEASNWALKHYQPWNRFSELTRAGTLHTARDVMNQMGRVGMAIEEGLAQTWQNARTGLQMYGREVGAVAAGYLATAKVGLATAGRALVTGASIFANIAGCLVTPLFIIGDLDTFGFGGGGNKNDMI